MVTTPPSIYDAQQLAEFTAVSELPHLADEKMRRIAELAERNLGVDEEPMRYRGTMERAATC